MKFWNRYTRLHIGNKVVTSDDLDIFFSIKANTESEADIAEITIFNLADETKEQIQPDTPVNLEAGYKGDYGTIFLGTVNMIEDEIAGADIKTTITCIGDMSKFLEGYVNKTYPANIKLIDVAKDQVQLAGITNFKFDDSDIIFENAKPYTSATNLRTNLTEIAKNLDYDFFERRGSVLMVAKNSGITEGFLLNSDSGLLEVQKIVKKEDDGDKYDYDVTSLLIYRIAQGSIIEIDSKISGNKVCKVEEVAFISNEMDFVNQMKVKIL